MTNVTNSVIKQHVFVSLITVKNSIIQTVSVDQPNKLFGITDHDKKVLYFGVLKEACARILLIDTL